MSITMFDDFIELDLLDTSAAPGDMFSFYLGASDDSASDLGAAAAALIASPEDEADSSVLAMDLVVKQEDSSDTDSSMLVDSSPLNQDPLELATETQSYGDSVITIVSPDQLTIAPQDTFSLAATTLLSSSTAQETTIAMTPTAEPSPTLKGAAPVTTTASKRPSPEPSAPPRKHAKTDSLSSKSKSSSARKSSVSSPTTASKAVSPAKSMNSSSPASPITSSPTTAALTTESLTSTESTTLSPATLQFLLQQQEETPLIPQLFTGKLSREEIEATLTRLLESTKHLMTTPDEHTTIKEEPMSDDDSEDSAESTEIGDAAEQTHGLKTQPGIKTDDIPSSTDLKKMTSKERRQLRNKISARNFRVRRKEYIFTLEGQVLQHKTEARHLREAVTLVQEENLRLKSELDQVKNQLAGASLSNSAAAIDSAISIAAPTSEQVQPAVAASQLSRENQTLLSSILNNTPSLSSGSKSNFPISITRPQSPLITLNVHKDVPNSPAGSTGQTSWKDKNPIMVHTTLVPEIHLGDEFQFGDKVGLSKDDSMVDRPWMLLDDKMNTWSNGNPFWESGLVLELMHTFVGVTFMTMEPESDKSIVDDQEIVQPNTDTEEKEQEEDLAWQLQQNLWAQEDEMTDDEQIQLLYDLSQLQVSNPRGEIVSSQEDPNMIEWLYESMMARLVDMDLQSTSQEQSSLAPLSDAYLA